MLGPAERGTCMALLYLRGLQVGGAAGIAPVCFMPGEGALPYVLLVFNESTSEQYWGACATCAVSTAG